MRIVTHSYFFCIYFQGCDRNNLFKNKPQSLLVFFLPLQFCLKRCSFYGDRLRPWRLSQARTCRSGRESRVQSPPTLKEKGRRQRGRRRDVSSAPRRCGGARRLIVACASVGLVVMGRCCVCFYRSPGTWQNQRCLIFQVNLLGHVKHQVL